MMPAAARSVMPGWMAAIMASCALMEASPALWRRVEFAWVLDGAEGGGEVGDVQQAGTAFGAESGGCPCGKGAGVRVVGLAPETVPEVAIAFKEGTENSGEIGEGADFIDAGDFGCVGGGGVELGAGEALGTEVAGGEEEDFAVAAGGVEVVADVGGYNEERGAGLIPASQVVEVGVLAEGIEVGEGFVGGEDQGDALVEGSAEADAAVVVVGGGLAVEGEEGQGEEEKKKGETGAGPHREGV
jgi:hypothetical protein